MNSHWLHFETYISSPPKHSISLAEQPFVGFVESQIGAGGRAAVSFDERRKVREWIPGFSPLLWWDRDRERSSEGSCASGLKRLSGRGGRGFWARLAPPLHLIWQWSHIWCNDHGNGNGVSLTMDAMAMTVAFEQRREEPYFEFIVKQYYSMCIARVVAIEDAYSHWMHFGR